MEGWGENTSAGEKEGRGEGLGLWEEVGPHRTCPHTPFASLPFSPSHSVHQEYVCSRYQEEIPAHSSCWAPPALESWSPCRLEEARHVPCTGGPLGSKLSFPFCTRVLSLCGQDF